jgi:hypothetical protein
MVQLAVLVPAEVPVESTTCAVKPNVPLPVGVPVMAPVDEFSDRPGGRVPLIMEKV